MRNYWKSAYVTELPDETIDLAIDHASQTPSPFGELAFFKLGGAINRVRPHDTAYPHQSSEYWLFIRTGWEDSVDDSVCIDWTRKFFEQLPDKIRTGAYANFVSDPDDEIHRVYGENYSRLVSVKSTWDPDNRFRLNQNIKPAT